MKCARCCLHALLFAVGLFGLLVPPVSAQSLVLAETRPPGHILVRVEDFLRTSLAARTGGQIALQVRHSGELGSESSSWDKVRDGGIDMVRLSLATVANEVPAARVLGLPFLFQSREHLSRAMAGEYGRRLAAEFEASGAIMLTWYDSGARCFYSSKQPIRNAADFQGLRIRVQDSPVYRDLITQLGGMPVVLAYDKVAEALRNGEIDAAENNAASYYTSGHYKLAKYFSMDGHSLVPDVLLMSRKSWQALTPERQKIVLASAADSSEYAKILLADSEAQTLARLRKEGVVVTEKSQIAMFALESLATRLYSPYLKDPKDIKTVLGIITAK